MTDVYNAETFAFQSAYQREKMIDILTLQAAGGFIHQNDSRARGYCAAYLDDLPRRYRQSGNAAFRADFRMRKCSQNLQRSLAHFLLIDPADVRWLQAHHDIFGHSQL